MLARLLAVLVVGVALADGGAQAQDANDVQPFVRFTMMRDGSVEVDGVRYRDAAKLKAKVLAVEALQPKPKLAISEEPGTSIKAVMESGILLQNSGLHVGYTLQAPQYSKSK